MEKILNRPRKKWLGDIVIIAVFLLSLTPQEQWGWWTAFLITIPTLLGLAALLVRYSPPVRTCVSRLARLRPAFPVPERLWVVSVALLTLMVATLISFKAFGNLSCVEDEDIQYIQARIFASGHLYAKSHALPQFFDVWRFANDGKYYGMYPPGHSMVMAVLMWLHLEWLTGPILGAVGSIFLYYLTKEVAGIRAARIATVLLLCSQYYMFMAAGYMNHMTSFACTVAFALFYICTHKHQRKTDALYSGMALGFLFITRPQVAVPLVIPFVVHWMWDRRWLEKERLLCAAIMIAVGSAFGGFFLYYNWQTTGSPWLTGYEKLFPANTGLSRFQEKQGWLDLGEDMARVVTQTQWLHTNLFDWPMSSLVFIVGLFLLRMQGKYGYLLIAAVLTITLSLILNIYNLNFFPPRYLFEASPFCILLTAQAIERLPAWIRAHTKIGLTLPEARQYVFWNLFVLFALALPYKIVADYQQFSHLYWFSNPEYARMVQNGIEHTPAILLYSGLEPYYLFIAMATNSLPPDPKNPVILARQLGAQNESLLQLYPDRYIYTVDALSIRLYRAPITVH